MKRILSIMALVVSVTVNAQQEIEVSREFKTVMIFPSAVDTTIVAEKAAFVIEKGSQGPLGGRILSLQVNVRENKTDRRSNLSVITEDGRYYDYRLEQVAEPERTTYNIDPETAMFSIAPQVKVDRTTLKEDVPGEEGAWEEETDGTEYVVMDTREKKGDGLDDTLYATDKDEYMRRRCLYNQFNDARVFRVYGKYGKVLLWLRGVYYDREELYFQFKLENKETIDYDINFVKAGIGPRTRGASTEQVKWKDILFRYKVPERVKGGTENYFVLVFPKFSLAKKQDFIVQIAEKEGVRDIVLKMEDYLVNRAKGF